MKSLTDAKSAAEQAGTDRTEKFRPKLGAGIMTGVVLVALVWSTLVYQDSAKDYQAAKAAQATTAPPAVQTTTVQRASDLPAPITLQMEPGKESQRVPVPYRLRVVMGGTDFEWNCYYSDGHKETVHCHDGDVVEVSVTNTRKDAANTVIASYQHM